MNTSEVSDTGREDASGHVNAFKAWYYFPLHVILVTALAGTVVYYVDEHHFKTGTPDIFYRRLPMYQTDALYIIGAVLVIIKLTAGACLSLISWRLIYILLERERGGLTLSEICRVSEYNCPILPGKNKRWLATLIGLLAWPSMVAEPLMTGSIGWVAGVVYDTPLETKKFAEPGTSVPWNSYQQFPESRLDIVLRAAGSAYAGSLQAFDSDVTILRRTFPISMNIPVNSTIADLKIPFISIDSLEWINVEELTYSMRKAVDEEKENVLNITTTTGVITRPLIGNTALLKDTQWKRRFSKPNGHKLSSYDFPEDIIFEGEKFVAVQVARPTDDNRESYNCTSPESPAFGLLPDISFAAIYWGMGGDYAATCYAIARVKLRAGSYISPSSLVLAPGIAEAELSTPVTKHPIASPLVEEIFAAMPEVMANMAAINMTNALMWNNLEGYVRGMLMVSYQETWSAMMTEFANGTRDSGFHPPRNVVTAHISKWSVSTWLALNLCVLVAGVLLYYMQRGADGKTMRNKTMAAMTMDLTQLYGKIPDLADAVEPDKPEKVLGKVVFSNVTRKRVVQVVQAETTVIEV